MENLIRNWLKLTVTIKEILLKLILLIYLFLYSSIKQSNETSYRFKTCLQVVVRSMLLCIYNLELVPLLPIPGAVPRIKYHQLYFHLVSLYMWFSNPCCFTNRLCIAEYTQKRKRFHVLCCQMLGKFIKSWFFQVTFVAEIGLFLGVGWWMIFKQGNLAKKILQDKQDRMGRRFNLILYYSQCMYI